MKKRSWVNWVLFLALLVTTALCWVARGRDMSRPNYDFVPEAQMAVSPAYDSFSPNPNFADGLTLRTPPSGTVARRQPLPLHYQPTLDDALRAGRELHNPYREDDAARHERGEFVFTNYCQVCHGPLGQGNGPITQYGFPPPASLLAERAVQMRDGQMFHVLTYGQQNMPAFNAQLSQVDRWSVILHVRLLQGTSAPSSPLSRYQQVARLFHENCAACHSDDGSGSGLRKVWPLIPDFTSPAWQMSQTEMALVNQIGFGSHPLMPAFRYRLPQDQILQLAVYVRSFAGHTSGLPVAASSHLTAANVYGTYCFVCHDTNGKGNPQIRPAMPELPDFTSVSWQKSRADGDFAKSILLGKGKFMLPMSDKLGTVDMKNMVALVRRFEGGKQIVPLAEIKEVGPPVVPTTEETTSGNVATVKGSQEKPPTVPTIKNSRTQQQFLEAETAKVAERIRMGANIYQQRCIVCHGPDGRGTAMRPALPPIPDFTTPNFHKEHSDAQMRVSILDGKNTMMPANRGWVTENQAADLVAYLRAFCPPYDPRKTVVTQPSAPSDDFERAYQRLVDQWNELEKELEKAKGKK